MDDIPIACTLDAGNLKDRLASIASLNARSLKGSRRDGLTLTLNYLPSALEDVRKMVAGEQICCAFLDFRIQEEAEQVTVTIVAPEEAKEAAENLFRPFASRGRLAANSCGCRSECGA